MVLLSNRQIHIHFVGRGCDGSDSSGVSCSFGVGMLSADADASSSEESVSFPASFSLSFPQAQREAIMQAASSRQRSRFIPLPLCAAKRAEQIKNARISTATMVEPTGVPARMETRIPSAAQLTDSTAEQTVTDRKFWKRRMADSAGKITSGDQQRADQIHRQHDDHGNDDGDQQIVQVSLCAHRLGKVFVKGHGKDFIVKSRNTATTAADSATHSRTSL